MQVSSACMVCYMLERSQYVQCHSFSVLYGVPAILSLQLSTILMIIDSIVPCITNKSKVISKLYIHIRIYATYCSL